MTLLYLVAAWLTGIFLAAQSHTTALTWLALAVAAVGMAFVAHRQRPWRLFFLCGALLAFGAARYAWADRPLSDEHIAHYNDSGPVTFTGVVIEDADPREQYVNLRVSVEQVETPGGATPSEGLVLVQAGRYGDYQYGDRVRASGQLKTPPEFDDFSYRDYLARRGIHAILPDATVTVLEHDQGKPWMAVLYNVKSHAQRTINRLLPSPQAPLLSGILIGVESSIPPDVRDDFDRTGTSHIIAISGSNIIVVIQVLMGLLKPSLGTRRAASVTLVGVAGYTLLVGADPAVMRAAIMGGLALVAAQLGRRTYGYTSLAFAAWLMTLWNPHTLWDLSFQLSAGATLGLLLFSEDFTAALQRLLERGFAQETAQEVTRWLSEPLVVSVAAQITTTPLILFTFGRLSIISLAANIFIVPVQSSIMVLGWLAVLVGMIWPLLGQPLAWIAWLPLTYTLKMAHALGRLDWASVDVPGFSTTHITLFYGALALLAVMQLQHPDDRRTLLRALSRRITPLALGGTALVLTFLVWATALTQPDGKLHVWFLDVGQGRAVLIQTPNGAQILVDGGPNPARLRSAVGDALPFWDAELDILIVTQPKYEAINALPALLERYDVRQAFSNGQPSQGESMLALRDALGDTPLQALSAGNRLQTSDDVQIEVLHPQVTPAALDQPENTGLVLKITYGEATFLLTPDLNAEGEQAMLSAGWYVGSTVLELPFRGRASANDAQFLNAVQPQVAVVGVEASNYQQLPDADVIERLRTYTTQPLYRTDHHGTVEIVTDGHTLQVFTARE